MTRFLARHRLCEFAATLLVVFLAVSVADIADYDAHRSALRASVNGSTAHPASDIIRAPSGSDSTPDHACCCLLCDTTLADSFGHRVLPPSAGKLSRPLADGAPGAGHIPEVFHPPPG